MAGGDNMQSDSVSRRLMALYIMLEPCSFLILEPWNATACRSLEGFFFLGLFVACGGREVGGMVDFIHILLFCSSFSSFICVCFHIKVIIYQSQGGDNFQISETVFI